MEQKAKPFVSKAQATRAYQEYKKGNISYPDLMKGVHATPNMKDLPDRVTEKKSVDKKTRLSIEGLV